MNVSPANILVAAWTVWLASWLIAAAWSSRTARRPPVRDARTYQLFVTVGAALLFGAFPHWAWLETALWQPGTVLQWVLLVVALLGLVLTWWARLALGRMWSGTVTRKVDHQIITNGPYRFVRHPIYSGILLAVIAGAVFRGTAGSCLGAASMVIGFFVKARLEERFLRSELGEERYGAYARKVPMLVPLRGVRPRWIA
jgi:protein-S-isoprenylcysteine O-methyltransferase Ste14